MRTSGRRGPMSGLRRALGLAVLVTAAGGVAGAGEAPPAAPWTVADLAWLAGAWQGTVGEDPVEELWSTPRDGTMVGAFRWLGSRTLYEILLIEDTPEGPVMRLRHFDPGLEPWEDGGDALVLRLVELGDGLATFRFGASGEGGPLTFRREGARGLSIELTLHQGGRAVPHTFRLARTVVAGDPDPEGR